MSRHPERQAIYDEANSWEHWCKRHGLYGWALALCVFLAIMVPFLTWELTKPTYPCGHTGFESAAPCSLHVEFGP